jgi:hypothetical protein
LAARADPDRVACRGVLRHAAGHGDRRDGIGDEDRGGIHLVGPSEAADGFGDEPRELHDADEVHPEICARQDRAAAVRRDDIGANGRSANGLESICGSGSLPNPYVAVTTRSAPVVAS